MTGYSPIYGWITIHAVNVDSREHSALRVALEDTRTGGAATRRGLTVEHATKAAEPMPEHVEVGG